jgi:hypothetical protein
MLNYNGVLMELQPIAGLLRSRNVINLSFVRSRKGAKSQSLEPIPLRLRVSARVIFRKN